MKIYLVCEKTTKCCGHGCYEEVITLNNDFPAFISMAKAEEFKSKLELPTLYNIITINVIEGE